MFEQKWTRQHGDVHLGRTWELDGARRGLRPQSRLTTKVPPTPAARVGVRRTPIRPGKRRARGSQRPNFLGKGWGGSVQNPLGVGNPNRYLKTPIF